jgi:hypothetical protein
VSNLAHVAKLVVWNIFTLTVSLYGSETQFLPASENFGASNVTFVAWGVLRQLHGSGTEREQILREEQPPPYDFKRGMRPPLGKRIKRRQHSESTTHANTQQGRSSAHFHRLHGSIAGNTSFEGG